MESERKRERERERGREREGESEMWTAWADREKQPRCVPPENTKPNASLCVVLKQASRRGNGG